MAPHKNSTGLAKARKTRANSTAQISPPQKEIEEILLASSVFFLPRARERALAPPTPKRFEMAVSMTKEEYTTVTAAVCSG